MITVKIHGGLGNQLFQYAFARSISLKNNSDFNLDISFFKQHLTRTYSLNNFCIKENIATEAELAALSKDLNTRTSFFKSQLFKKKTNFINEKSLLFDEVQFKTSGATYFNGYWQNERYFKDIDNIIRQEFRVNTNPSATNMDMLGDISSKNAISLHIRRGDFNTDVTINKVHGTCSMEYYQEAIQLIASKCAEPYFFIFSDDLAWVKQNMDIKLPHTFVDINAGITDFEDLRLMYSCKHHIIANSTFSWWGGWLNPNPHKIVVAPKTWFNDPELNLQAKDIVPETWIRL